MMYAAHQLQSIIPPKMTAMMQLTDTDFSYVFKSLMRKSVDKIMAKGQQAMGTSDVYQMGECNENIENLLKIIEKRKKRLKKSHTSRASYSHIQLSLPSLLALASSSTLEASLMAPPLHTRPQHSE